MSPSKKARCTARAASTVFALTACAGAAHAQALLVPFSHASPVTRHIPAPLPFQKASPDAFRGTAQLLPAFVAPGPLVPRSAPAWIRPQAGANPLITAGLPDIFTPLGPAPLTNAGGTFGGSSANVSGRVTAIAADPSNQNTFYIGAAGGGVWKTTDGGQTYTSLTDNISAFRDLSIGAIAVDQKNPNTIYVGTGEPNNNGDAKYGVGVYKTTDGGQTWTLYTGDSPDGATQGAFALQAVSKIVIDPTNSNILYLTTAYANSGIGGTFGVYKSTDGGQTWTNTTANAGLTSTTNYSDLVLDPTDSTANTLYAAVGSFYGGDEYGNAGNNGVYKTTNGGATWALAGNFPQNGNIGRIALGIAPTTPGTPANGSTLYASVTNPADQSLYNLYKSTNSGIRWAALPKSTDGTGNTGVPNYIGSQGFYNDTVVVDPVNPNILFAGGQVNYAAFNDPNGPYGKLIGIVGSRDGGATWTDYSVGVGGSGPHTDHHALAFDAAGRLLNGNDGGVWRLENALTNPNPTIATDANGAGSNIQWTDVNGNLNTIQFTGIALHPTDPNIAYGGAQDNGTSKFTGSTAWNQIIGGDGGFTRVDQTNPQTVYQEFTGISLDRSDDGGITFYQKTTGIHTTDNFPHDAGDPSNPTKDPSNFYVPYVLDPVNQSRVILGTDHVYESLNKADLFTAIGTPGVAGFNPVIGTTDTGDPEGNTVNAVAVNGSTVYAATSYNIYVTHNDGTSWLDVTPPTLTPNINGAYRDLYVNPNDPNDIYTVRGVFSGRGHIFRSTDGGATWSNINGNLPNQPYSAIKLDKAAGVLYVGGDDGVYASSDFGQTWGRYAASLPAVQVVDLVINKALNVVAAGTHGRGLWEAPLTSNVARPNLIATNALSRSNTGQIVDTITIKNVVTSDRTAGTADAPNLQIGSVTLNGRAGVPQTQAASQVGTVPAAAQVPSVGATSTVVYVFPVGGPAAGVRAVVSVSGTFTGGTFNSGQRVSAP